jgi:Fe-S-cluster-containing dehydrogenase component/formate-dependent nitrite reductase membrane component NrfD
MPTFGFLIDNRKCIGCHACTVACKSEHEVPIGVDRTWVKYIEKGTFPNNRRLFTVMRCNHCDYAPCVTICPVTALYRRQDGVVDFNSDRCIGCKACLQACPYDALYIDPNSHTAAKCNFCTHRLEIGLEPSCVVVCPEQAIVCGDLDDPRSKLSKLIERHPVQVRKPEKGTKPKLFYIDGDEAALVPSRTGAGGQGMFSRGAFVSTVDPIERDGAPDSLPTPVPQSHADSVPSPRRVYDVRPRPPAWGWPVVLYTWTKSIAAGAMLAALVASLFDGTGDAALAMTRLGGVALLFLTITAGLLVGDLEQPNRFLNVLLRPQWKSWLVRGAYVLVTYGGSVTAWLACHTLDATTAASLLRWPAGILGVPAAVYTAFLFAQAKGRDFWQNPLLSVHLLAHALLAGGAAWLLVQASVPTPTSRIFMLAALGFSLLAVLGELLTTPPTEDARRAMQLILRRPLGGLFWGVGIGSGHIIPMALLATGAVWQTVLASLLALMGILVIERLWVLAPQQIPLS